MARPFKPRKLSARPRAYFFRPDPGQPGKREAVLLRLDEFQALEAAELRRLGQAAAAAAMDISRQTFGNILASARRKLAEAVVNGKAIRIAGGPAKTYARPPGRKNNGTPARK